MITQQTTLEEIKTYALFRRLFRYFAYDGTENGSWTLSDGHATLLDLQQRYVTWNAADMAYGLNALLAQEENNVELTVYSEQEIAENADKADVKLFYIKADAQTRQNKTCILAAGGAYGTVYSLVEAFPVAAALAEKGLDTFCLNYRVGTAAPLFPQPMEDMAAAVRFLLDRADELHIHMENYAVGGFSAGGHLAACFGLQTIGYARYGAPRPSLVMLNYPMTDVWENVLLFPEPIRSDMLKACFGENGSKECSDAYNPTLLADGRYPPCFIAQTENDSTVPIRFTEAFADRLTSLCVPVAFFRAESGYHGYGLGTGCDAYGWVERAVRFWDRLS